MALKDHRTYFKLLGTLYPNTSKISNIFLSTRNKLKITAVNNIFPNKYIVFGLKNLERKF